MTRTYRIGLVGCGHISHSHLRAFARAPSCEVVGVLDLDRELATKRARQFGIGRIYDSLEELIQDVDVVDVCTPPQSHAVIALPALEAGKHLVVEKPVVIALEDWAAIRDAAAVSGVSLTVIHNLKHSRGVQRAMAWVRAGRIGRVTGLTREFMTDPSSDRMLTGERHWSHQLPGGRWFETLPHELYLTHYFIGDLPLNGVTAVRTAAAPEGVPADEVVISLADERGIATIRFSASARANKRRLTLHGTEGEIEVDVLSDAAVLRTQHDARWKRAPGLVYLEAAGTVGAGFGERVGYLWGRVRGDDPHSRIIRVLDRHLAGDGPEPTPLAEIDYVVHTGEKVGRAIESAVVPAQLS